MSGLRMYAVDVVHTYDRSANPGSVFASCQNRTIRVAASSVLSAIDIASKHAMQTVRLESYGGGERKIIPATGLTVMQVRDAGWPIDCIEGAHQ